MSINEEWLNGAMDSFTDALLQEDLTLAKDIIADTFDAGFPGTARIMSVTLRAVDFTKTTNQS